MEDAVLLILRQDSSNYHSPLDIAKEIYGPDGSTSMINPILYSLAKKNLIEKVAGENGRDPKWKFKSTITNYKGLIQEWAQKKGFGLPHYQTITVGTSFQSRVSVQDQILGQSSLFSNKKDAEQDAAQKAWRELTLLGSGKNEKPMEIRIPPQVCFYVDLDHMVPLFELLKQVGHTNYRLFASTHFEHSLLQGEEVERPMASNRKNAADILLLSRLFSAAMQVQDKNTQFIILSKDALFQTAVEVWRDRFGLNVDCMGTLEQLNRKFVQ